jgi:hypothetical protein
MFEHINSSLPHVILFFILKLSKSTPLSTPPVSTLSRALYSIATPTSSSLHHHRRSTARAHRNCHTPVLENRTKSSIRVPRMFKSHVRPTIW